MSSPFPRRRPVFRAGGVALVLLLAGCGPARKSVFPVQGQVLDSDGKPAVGAKVIFHPLDDKDPNAARPLGLVDDAGTFSLTTYNRGDGAAPGSYAVTIEWRGQPTPINRNPEDKLKGRFANANKSPFKATVGNQPTTLEPFRLD
jgi:hypothetical protein